MMDRMPDTAQLYSLFWNQSGSNADKCFVFSFGKAQQKNEDGEHYLNCGFCAEDGEFVECRDVHISKEQWKELDAALHDFALPVYSPPDPYLMDAVCSRVEICLTDNGSRFTGCYDGEYAHEFYEYLTAFIRQIIR